jgi:hypothetical protein
MKTETRVREQLLSFVAAPFNRWSLGDTKVTRRRIELADV